MTISAEIICDSISLAGKRLTTFVLKYPRWIHSELMTHAMLSRNASSSRAIPVKKMIDQVLNDPAIPVKWVKNQPGMQASEVLDPVKAEQCERVWLDACDYCVNAAQRLVDAGLHKQLANRIIEPWMHITVIVTATEWANFFTLRWHKDAEDNFQVLTERMRQAFIHSKPNKLEVGEWHLPFITEEDRLYAEPCAVGNFNNLDADAVDEVLLRWSTARCARVSYMNHDGTNPDTEKDMALFEKLMGGNVKHSSPTGHQGMALEDPNERSGNFIGFKQFRKLIRGENATEFPEGFFDENRSL